MTVAVPNLDYLATTGTGLRLRRTGVLDLCYSYGIWIDATGRQQPIPARYDHGRILLTVPAPILATATYPAILDPQIIVTPIT